MEEKATLLETLLEKTGEYGQTTIELVKLKTLDKASDIVSSLLPRSVVVILITSFILFLNLGLALWLGDILGKTFYGFFAIAGFYMVAGLVIRFLLYKWIKKLVGNWFIKTVLK